MVVDELTARVEITHGPAAQRAVDVTRKLTQVEQLRTLVRGALSLGSWREDLLVFLTHVDATTRGFGNVRDIREHRVWAHLVDLRNAKMTDGPDPIRAVALHVYAVVELF